MSQQTGAGRAAMQNAISLHLETDYKIRPAGAKKDQRWNQIPNLDGSRWKGSFTDLLVEEINAQKSVPKRPPSNTSFFQQDAPGLKTTALEAGCQPFSIHHFHCQEGKKDENFSVDFNDWEAVTTFCYTMKIYLNI